MITYDFDDFLTTIKFLDKEDILLTSQKKCKALEKGWNRPNKKDALILADKINGLIVWLETGKKPDTLTANDFEKIKAVCQNLVRKEQVPAEWLNEFPNNEGSI